MIRLTINNIINVMKEIEGFFLNNIVKILSLGMQKTTKNVIDLMHNS